MYLTNPDRCRARTYQIISAIIIAISYQDFTFKLALRLYHKMPAPTDYFKTFHWLSNVTCFHCQTEAFTAVFSHRWNYRNVTVTTDFYIRVLKFERPGCNKSQTKSILHWTYSSGSHTEPQSRLRRHCGAVHENALENFIFISSRKQNSTTVKL